VGAVVRSAGGRVTGDGSRSEGHPRHDDADHDHREGDEQQQSDRDAGERQGAATTTSALADTDTDDSRASGPTGNTSVHRNLHDEAQP
jgi:hypothetical protein